MDKQQARQQIRDIFQNIFHRERYGRFIRNLLNDFESREGHYSGNLIPEAFSEHITQYWRIGKYVDPAGAELDLLIVEVKSFAKLDRARTALRNFAVNRLKQFEKDCSLVAFYAKDDSGADWRFSFVKIEHTAFQDDKGKVRLKSELTPAKRYSYLVGIHENSHTAQNQLLDLLIMDYANPTIGQIEAAFSIEKVTDEFFSQYKDLYLKLSEQIKSQPLFKKGTAEENAQVVARFAKKLLGQIVFLYFLQKKGWLGVSKTGKWGTGPRRFMAEHFQRIVANGGDYYHNFLQYLFYEALAQERRYQSDPDFYDRFSCKIPFLNGGLFEADYDWRNITLSLPNELFRNEEKNKAGDTGTGILDVFERYNFTIKEDEPLEKEVAVDPEMLGKVFENMLEITERKSKGAFYTPREIVHYMCQESLIHYLDSALNNYITAYQEFGSNQTSLLSNADRKGQGKLAEEHQDIKVPKADIEYFIRNWHLFAENDEVALQALNRVERGEQKSTKHRIEIPRTVKENARIIDAKLAAIRVCDPAIGSGAFPVGLLHEIVGARQALATHSGNQESLYELKRHSIRESLYGVDIDTSAIDIARLRLWLSLIVDEDDYSTIEALPNLDYKIVRGDSLIGFPENWKSPTSEKIEKLKNNFFSETNPQKKANLKEQIDTEIQARMANSQKIFGYQINFDFRLLFSEVWHERDGFDVIIGNPPFISHDRLPQEHKSAFKKLFSAYNPYADAYCFFLEKALSLQNSSGLSVFITSNSYLRANYGMALRQLIRTKNSILELINIEDSQLFKEAIVNTAIIISTGQMRCQKSTVVNASMKLKEPIDAFVRSNMFIYTQDDYNRVAWILIPSDQLKVLHKICSNKETLDSLKTKIRLGLATGDNDAFIIPENEKTKFIRKSKKNADIIKPVLRGRDIERYCHAVPSHYILLAKNGIDIQKEYPDIYDYFDSQGEKFKHRGAKGKHWSNLRPCSFLDDFKEEKIIWIELSDKGRFAYSNEEVYLLNTAYYLLPPDSLDAKYLLGILNSSLIQYVLFCTAETSGMGTLRWFNTHVKEFPVVIAEYSLQYIITRLVDYLIFLCSKKPSSPLMNAFLEDLVDGSIYELYFPEEIKTTGKEIFQHIGELKPLTDDMSDAEKLAIIQSEFDRLYDPKHLVRNHLETLDSVEVVRTIREALK